MANPFFKVFYQELFIFQVVSKVPILELSPLWLFSPALPTNIRLGWKFLTAKTDFLNLLEGIASFCHQVAALVPDIFGNFYLVKNRKNGNNSATTEAREKISTYLESLEFQKFFNVGLTKFENPQLLLNKMNHRFLVTKWVKEPQTVL